MDEKFRDVTVLPLIADTATVQRATVAIYVAAAAVFSVTFWSLHLKTESITDTVIVGSPISDGWTCASVGSVSGQSAVPGGCSFDPLFRYPTWGMKSLQTSTSYGRCNFHSKLVWPDAFYGNYRTSGTDQKTVGSTVGYLELDFQNVNFKSSQSNCVSFVKGAMLQQLAKQALRTFTARSGRYSQGGCGPATWKSPLCRPCSSNLDFPGMLHPGNPAKLPSPIRCSSSKDFLLGKLSNEASKGNSDTSEDFLYTRPCCPLGQVIFKGKCDRPDENHPGCPDDASCCVPDPNNNVRYLTCHGLCDITPNCTSCELSNQSLPTTYLLLGKTPTVATKDNTIPCPIGVEYQQGGSAFGKPISDTVWYHSMDLIARLHLELLGVRFLPVALQITTSLMLRARSSLIQCSFPTHLMSAS
jgi:hypothetical protein